MKWYAVEVRDMRTGEARSVEVRAGTAGEARIMSASPGLWVGPAVESPERAVPVDRVTQRTAPTVLPRIPDRDRKTGQDQILDVILTGIGVALGLWLWLVSVLVVAIVIYIVAAVSDR